MTKLCPRGKAAAKRKFSVYPSAYANAYASKICAGKAKDPSGLKRKDFKGPKPAGKKVGGEIKLKKVIKGLKKASRTHAGQAKSLSTLVKKQAGGMLGGMGGAGSGLGRLQKFAEQTRRRRKSQEFQRQQDDDFDPNVGDSPKLQRGPYRPGDNKGTLQRGPYKIGDNKGSLQRGPYRPDKEELKQMRKKIKETNRKGKEFNQGGMAREEYQGSYIKSDLAGEPVSNKSYEAYYKDLI